MVTSGKLIPLKNTGPGEHEDDKQADVGNGNTVSAVANPEILNSPAVKTALGIIKQGIDTSQEIVSTNKKAQQDVHTGMGAALGVLSMGLGVSAQALLAAGGAGLLPVSALPPISEDQAQNHPLALPAAAETAASASASPPSTPPKGKKAGNKATPKKTPPAKKAPTSKKVPTPRKKAASTPKAKAKNTTPKSSPRSNHSATPQSALSTPRCSARIAKKEDMDDID